MDRVTDYAAEYAAEQLMEYFTHSPNWVERVVGPQRQRQQHYDDGSDDVLVIGLDFGTTFSGAAWATAADLQSDQINVVTTWPGTGYEEGKAPTELFYEDGNVMWGYEVPPDGDAVRWFKLLLLKEEDLKGDLRTSEILGRGRRMLRDHNRTAVDLVADYLRLLWKHVVKSIHKARGELVVDAMTFHVVITVPAIWKDYARERMRQAAKKAGILSPRVAGQTTLSFAPEPEAAALATLCEPGRSVKPGDVYVVCDAGGGTVDLISYRVERTVPIVMSEAVEGTGGLCGGIFIDEGFESVCKARLGRRWDHLSKAGIKEIVKGDWERGIKPQFRGGNVDSLKEYIVSIPAEAFRNGNLDDVTRRPYIKKGRIHFSSGDIASTFTWAFEKIDKLVDQQIAKVVENAKTNVPSIILVGGLGGSPFLYEHLKDRYSYFPIAVLQAGGMKSRTAISRGAVLKGFLNRSNDPTLSSNNHGANRVPISVSSTISRANVGVRFSEPFDPARHLQKDKVWRSEQGIFKVHNRMEWYIRKGERIMNKDPISHSFQRLFHVATERSFSDELLQCKDNNAPSTYRPNMTELCRIDWQLDASNDELAKLEDWTHAKTGAPMKWVEYEISLIPSGASFEFIISFNGRRLGASNVNIRIR
ncbi:hypothetical protein B0T16DRAFT_213993 [Cercophora newfieldiana]|uniref:Actin-like ATPase domain-containing protein n=1 Tax=Cercophora newfieldiana TaxID=92897 RepID=A0AA40CLG2_9PEZI|nr:hypothetical protein B0T16DRAFT_213993 [Cercophora newfieldiana]